jgi:hypothetical protein
MYSYLLQDWTTLRQNQSVTSVTQSEADWMSFQPYQDIAFWFDCDSVILGGATNIQLIFQTAPAKDEGLFQTLGTAQNLSAGTTNVLAINLSGNPSVPLARWVRWKLAPNGGALAGEWGATFRVHATANAVGVIG